MAKIGRNDPCPCGSGKKHKKCCALNSPMQSTEVADFNWHKLRETDVDLAGKFMSFSVKEFPELLPCAWEEFCAFQDDLPDLDKEDPVFISAFLPYFFYNWVPDEADNEINATLKTTVAEAYMARYPNRIHRYEKRFISQNLKSYYSVYEILAVNPGESIRVKDILRNREFIVKEKMASKSLEIGLVLLARVFATEECNVFLGMYPQPLSTLFLTNIVQFKQRFSKPEFDDEDLLDRNMEIRDLFFDLLAEMNNFSMPRLLNTDDEDFLPTKLIFELSCSLEEALEKLLVLSLGNVTKEEVLEEATYTDEGAVDHIEFAWLVAGNKKHTYWEHTVFAHITLSGNQMTIGVNSSRRAKKARAKMSELLGSMAKYKTMVIEDVTSQLENMPAESNKDRKGFIDANEYPELKEKMDEMNSKHWESWLDSELPQLEGKTPRQAAKTKKGREMLEALFTGFHTHNMKMKKSDHYQPLIDLAYLRDSLGMN